MVVVMAPGATEEQITAVVTRVTDAGGEAFVSRGDERAIIGLIGDLDRFHGLNLRALPGVVEVVRISTPFKLVSRQHHPQMTTVFVGDARVPIGPDTFTLIAGPCAVETPEQTLAAADFPRMAALMAYLTQNCCRGMPGECLTTMEAALSGCGAATPSDPENAPR